MLFSLISLSFDLSIWISKKIICTGFGYLYHQETVEEKILKKLTETEEDIKKLSQQINGYPTNQNIEHRIDEIALSETQ